MSLYKITIHALDFVDFPALESYNRGIFNRKRAIPMKIAVTFDRGMVSQHFGHSETFKIFEVIDHKIVSTSVFSTFGSGHAALANLLHTHGVDTLLCSHVGNTAKLALAEAGISLYEGVSGTAKDAVHDLLDGSLACTSYAACGAAC